jgi:hypothetical protein
MINKENEAYCNPDWKVGQKTPRSWESKATNRGAIFMFLGLFIIIYYNIMKNLWGAFWESNCPTFQSGLQHTNELTTSINNTVNIYT